MKPTKQTKSRSPLSHRDALAAERKSLRAASVYQSGRTACEIVLVLVTAVCLMSAVASLHDLLRAAGFGLAAAACFGASALCAAMFDLADASLVARRRQRQLDAAADAQRVAAACRELDPVA